MHGVLKIENLSENNDRDLEKIKQTVQDNNKDAQDKNNFFVDNKRCGGRKCIVEDDVMVKNTSINTNPGTNKKCIPKFKDPYEVKIVILNNRYVVKDKKDFRCLKSLFLKVNV